MKQVLRLFILFSVIVSPWLAKAQVTASFTATPTTGCAPLILSIGDVSSSTSPITYQQFRIYWDSVGPGGVVYPLLKGTATYSSGGNTTNFFLSNTGNYNVVDSVVNSLGQSNVDTQHNYLFVAASPLTTRVSTTDSAADVNSCPGHTVVFVNKSDTVAGCTPVFTWNISGGPSGTPAYTTTTTGREETVTHTFTAVGTYAVLIQETTCNGSSPCQGYPSSPFYITIGALPTACFSNNDSTPCNTPASVTFANCSTGASTYLWKFGDGTTSTLTNPVHSYADTGIVTDTLIAYSSFGCPDTLIEHGNIIVSNFIPTFSVSATTICQNNSAETGTITATNTTVGATTFSWVDNYSPAHTSTLANPTFTYATAGTYTITETVSNAEGCSGMVKHTVTVEPAPVITFTASPLYRCTPNLTTTITPTVTDASGAVSYVWAFGDTHTTSGLAPVTATTHTYTASGTYNYSLTVTDANGCMARTGSSSTNAVNILAPTFNIRFASDSGCAFSVFAYTTSISSPTAAVTGGFTIDSVKFGDGTTSFPTTDTGSHIYTTGGTYTMVVTYTLPLSEGGCTYTKSQVLTVGTTHPIFTPSVITTTGVDTICPNTVFTVVGNCTNCTSFRWNFNSPSFPAGSAVLLYTSPYQTTEEYADTGKYRFQAIANDAGCTDTSYDSIYILPPTIGMSYAITNCDSPYAVTFGSGGSSATATAFHWDFGDGTFGTGPSPRHVYTVGTGHTYTVVLVDSAGGRYHCFNTDSLVINLYPFVNTFTASATTVCTGKQITFTGSKTPNGLDYTNYSWHFGNGAVNSVSGSNTTTYTYTQRGVYNDSLIIEYNGCYDTASIADYITVAGINNGFTANGLGSDTGCAEPTLPVNFVDTSNDLPGFTIIKRYWNFNAPPSVTGTGVPADALVLGTVTESANYPPGAYVIELIDSDNIGCTATSIGYVTAEQPNPYFYTRDSNIVECTGKMVQFHDTNTNCTYAWQFGDGGTGTGQNPTHIYTTNGSYSVTVTITTTAGGPIIAGCTNSYTSDYAITVGNVPISFSDPDSFSICAPLVGYAANTTNPGADSLTYQWRVTPSGAIVSTSQYGYLYNLTAGGTVYDITLIATSSITGCVDSVTHTAVTQGPAGYIHFTPDNGCGSVATTLCYTDTNNVSPTYYTWIFGDGSPVTNVSSAADTCVTHTYVTAGTYHPEVAITGGGCSAVIVPDAADSIQVFPIPTVTVTAAKDTICFNASTTLTASGAGSPGGQYTWSPSTGLSATTGITVTASPSITTTYTITGTTIHDCTSSTTITVHVDLPISVVITGADSVCANSQDQLTAIGSGGTGSGTYAWSPASSLSATTGNIVTATPTGSFVFYNVTYTDNFDYCTATYTKKVSVNQLPGTITASPSFTVCAGSGYSIQLTDNPAGTWSSGNNGVATVNNTTGLVTGVTAGNATITFTTLLGCDTTAVVTIAVSPTPIVGAANVCIGSTTTFSSTPAGLGTWTSSNVSIATVSSMGGAVYGVSVNETTISYTLPDGCTQIAPITVQPLPNITYLPDPAYICKGSTTQIKANQGEASYLWQPNANMNSNTVYDPVFDDTSNVMYALTETTSFGCVATDSIFLQVFDSGITSISADTIICYGDSAHLIAYSTSSGVNSDLTKYMWFPTTGLTNPNDSNNAEIYVHPDTTTTYQVTIFENPCYIAVRDVTVDVIPTPVIGITSSTISVTAGYSTQLNAMITNTVTVSSWLWSPSSTLSCSTCTNPIATPTINPTTYSVIATTPIGCVGESDVTVGVTCTESAQVFVPNTFTPNGDGNNDRFYLSGRGLGLITRMSIYNRWGEKVFEAEGINANDPGAGWDGTYRGQTLPPGVFIYVFDLLCETGAPFTLKGDVTIVK